MEQSAGRLCGLDVSPEVSGFLNVVGEVTVVEIQWRAL